MDEEGRRSEPAGLSDRCRCALVADGMKRGLAILPGSRYMVFVRAGHALLVTLLVASVLSMMRYAEAEFCGLKVPAYSLAALRRSHSFSR